jgi:BirA family transcriptional regulator, biotin operon repressor / biotin---[acetyl-CoA-carboxylase] ligase
VNAASLRAAGKKRGLPQPIQHVDETRSTNDDLSALARGGAPHGTALVADTQTAGRGRLGRSWSSAPGQGICMSILLRPALEARRAPLVSLAAACAVAQVANTVSDNRVFSIKWPNDVLDRSDAKVAGILAEVELDGPRVGWIVLGIGLNVHGGPGEFGATSLAAHGATEPRSTIAARLVEAALAETDRLVADPADCLDRWRRSASTLGRRITVGEHSGLAVDIDKDGALIVEVEGKRHRILAGDVRRA